MYSFIGKMEENWGWNDTMLILREEKLEDKWDYLGLFTLTKSLTSSPSMSWRILKDTPRCSYMLLNN